MSQLAPLGPIYQAGTLSGNPLATAAGLTVLSLLDDGAYAELAAIAGRLAAGIADACADAGLEVQVPVAGPLIGVFFGTTPVTDYEASKASAATGSYPGFMHGLLDRGIAVAPGAYEVLFPSLAHTDADLDVTVAAVAAVAKELAAA
jgi:glutamate-1-semialdehyde 2,1-aminomutase